jgi:FtsZ-binding cell division protein ZapB
MERAGWHKPRAVLLQQTEHVIRFRFKASTQEDTSCQRRKCDDGDEQASKEVVEAADEKEEVQKRNETSGSQKHAWQSNQRQASVAKIALALLICFIHNIVCPWGRAPPVW